MSTFTETAIVDYHLPFDDQGKQTSVFRFPFPFGANKRKFTVSIFHLQQTNGSCRFPLDPFSVCSSVSTNEDLWNSAEVGNFSKLVSTFAVFRKYEDMTWRQGDMVTWRWRHGNMETWRLRHQDMDMLKWSHGDMKTWRHEDMETWRHGDMETWRHGDMETWRHGDMETWRHGDMVMETWTWRHGKWGHRHVEAWK